MKPTLESAVAAFGTAAKSKLSNAEIGDKRPPSPLGDIQPASWLAEDTTELLKGGNALDWHTHVSCAADGGVVETVVLEAARIGAWPLQIDKRHPPRVPRRHCHSLHRVIA